MVSQPLNIKMKKIPFHLSTTQNQYPSSYPISAPSHSSTSHHHPSPKKTMMKSSAAPSQHPATASSRQFASIPPTYRTYHPEWTSVSPPALAPFDDHPEFYSAPPRKKLCHLLNPTFRSSSTTGAQHSPESHSSVAPLSTTANGHPNPASHIHSPCIQSPSETPQVDSCSVSPHDAYVSTHLQFPDDHDHGSYKYPASMNPQPMSFDEDRALPSRPLKNTKRAAQNRAAQRAFRERKDRYVRELEVRSTQFEEYISRYGLLEERERMVETREAELMHRSAKHGSPQVLLKGKTPTGMGEEASTNYGSKPGENDTNDYIAKLEDQLETCRIEITRLRSELLKVNDQDEDMEKGNRRLSYWQRGFEEGFTKPRPGTASDGDTGGPTSCSPGSPYAWSTSQALPRAHHPEWDRQDRLTGDSGQRIIDEEHCNNGRNVNRKSTSAADRHDKIEKIHGEESSRFGWSDGSRSPVSLSLSHQEHSVRVQSLSEDCDRQPRHHLSTPKLDCHHVPLHRANILDRQGKRLKLPAIHHHLNQIWRNDDLKR